VLTAQSISQIAKPNNLALSPIHPGVVKQILLRVTTVLAKILVAKFAKLLRGHLSFPREILLSQDALNPNIDRKRPQPFVSEEHYAVGHLRAHARQLA
jgi:hypothetical protein